MFSSESKSNSQSANTNFSSLGQGTFLNKRVDENKSGMRSVNSEKARESMNSLGLFGNRDSGENLTSSVNNSNSRGDISSTLFKDEVSEVAQTRKQPTASSDSKVQWKTYNYIYLICLLIDMFVYIYVYDVGRYFIIKSSLTN
jgi:hypothetical protein